VFHINTKYDRIKRRIIATIFMCPRDHCAQNNEQLVHSCMCLSFEQTKKK
jgi:hypothetical protein